MIWHNSDAASVIAELNSDKEQGLSSDEAELRLEEYGKNEIHDFEKPNFWKVLLKQSVGYLNIFLIAIALIYFAVALFGESSNWTEPILIILIVLINSFAGAFITYKNTQKVYSLRNSHKTYSTVLRDGTVQSVLSSELVPGDIMILSAGDYIRADGRLIESYVFICDEFPVTGDQVPVEKSADSLYEDISPLAKRNNMVFSGSYVQSGRAIAIVTETAEETAVGHAETIVKQTKNKSTPLESLLARISRSASIISIVAAILIFILGVLVNLSKDGFETTLLTHILLALSMVVSVIPKGLTTVLSIAVAFSAVRMQKRNITYTHLPSAESIGRTSVICTDKTGILTDENMELLKLSDGKNILSLKDNPLNESAVTLLHLSLICSNLNESEHAERHSNALELAIERASVKHTGLSKADIDGIYPHIAELPFSSDRMLMTAVTSINTKTYAVIKGAPDIVLSRCNDLPETAFDTLNSLADEGLKVLAVALKPLDTIPANPNSEELEHGLTFVGILGFENPPYPDSVKEIAECNRKGIRVVMLTGDYLNTAAAVAKQLGIIKDNSEVLDKSDLDLLSDDELSEKIDRYGVFSRISAEDKLRIVKALIGCGKRVLLTCDSVNDVAALAEADYGCALGMTASDSVRASADLVVNDNKFSTLTLALKESNRIFDSVHRSVKYLISCNSAEIIAILFGIIIFGMSPVAAAALLCINLITDLLPVLAFSAETQSKTLSLRRHEVRQDMSLLSIASIVLPAVIIAALTLIGYMVGSYSSPESAATIAFAVLAVCEIVHAFTLSHTYTVFQKGTIHNLVMPIACLISLAVVVLIVATPIGGLLSFTVLSSDGWLMLLVSAVITLIAGESTKFASKYYHRKRQN